MYCIQNVKTGNYMDSNSIFVDEEEVICCSCTGEVNGMEYYKTDKIAEAILCNLKTTLCKYNIKKDLQVLNVDRQNIPNGVLIKKHFIRTY